MPTRKHSHVEHENTPVKGFGMAHFNHDEIVSMTALQGEEIIDEATNLPSFPGLSEIFKDPELQEFLLGLKEDVTETGEIPKSISHMMNEFKEKRPEFFETTPSSDFGKKLKKSGVGNDTEIALVPFDVLEFFDEMVDGPHINPKDGLPMYFGPLLMAGGMMGLGTVLSAVGAAKDRSQQRNQFRQTRDDQEKYARQHIEREELGYQRYLQEKKEDREQAARDLHEAREKMGYNKGIDVNELKADRLKHELEFDPLRSHKSIHHIGSHAYKTGGLVGTPIKGPGKGQDDLIPFDNTKEGDWVWDASTVANLGDGSTKAGWDEIRKIEKAIKETKAIRAKEAEGGLVPSPKQVKTALSDGEYVTPNLIVTALGDGDNKKGADILREMTEKIRLYKISNGDKLPPPIGDPVEFLKEAEQEIVS